MESLNIDLGAFAAAKGSAQGPGAAVEPAIVGDAATLERNLLAVARWSPVTAEAIRQAAPHPGVELAETDEDAVALTLDGRAMCSKRRPRTEATRLAETVDPTTVAAVIVRGFGAGHHVRALSERLGPEGVVIVYEPDVHLLRTLFGRVDCSAWLASRRVAIVHDGNNGAAFSGALAGAEAVLGIGVRTLDHPPSVSRLAESVGVFNATLARVLAAMRTTLATTLVHCHTTLRNLLMNLDHYSRGNGVLPLAGALAGKPAVLVAAGPSLAKNIELLSQPGVRDRVCIIAVQTVLKPLLARGIKPHFVTALDHADISKRFYEGLTAEDVEGVTLVVEPKANAAILDAFPGAIRCSASELLDAILGSPAKGGMAVPMGELTAGATVAHLNYYLARYLGCDPVVLIGQDLGFTDGQYYAAGAAIHDVWAPELSSFNTLEMMEWQRLAREKKLLRRTVDIHGNPIFTDEQMSSYLAQFESAFARDAAAGRRIIDATEGGVRKQATEIMTLEAALASVRESDTITIPETTPTKNEASRNTRVCTRLDTLSSDADTLVGYCDDAITALEQMLADPTNTPEVNRLIGEIDRIKAKVLALEPAFTLSQFINQAGQLNRLKADRALEMTPDSDPHAKQRRQMERDLTNVQWIREAALELGRLLRAAASAHRGEAPKITADIASLPIGAKSPPAIKTATSPAPADEDAAIGEALQLDIAALASGSTVNAVTVAERVGAVVFVDAEVGGLGTPRSLDEEIAPGVNLLRSTVERLLASDVIDEIVLATGDPDRVQLLLGDAFVGRHVRIESIDRKRWRTHVRSFGPARAFARTSWRGGVGQLSVFDEIIEPTLALELMEKLGYDAAVFCGADWALVDPALTAELIRRHRVSPRACRMAFTQAPPGLAPVLLDVDAVRSLAAGTRQGSPFATAGGLTAYLPIAPQADPIAGPMCAAIDPAVRNLGLRCVPDSEPARRAFASAIELAGQPLATMRATDIAAALANTAQQQMAWPTEITIELCTGRLATGRFGAWRRGSDEPIERPVMTENRLRSILEPLCAERQDVAVHFDGAGDPLMHPDALRFVEVARACGAAAVHLRTDLLHAGPSAGEIIDANIDVISVDLLGVKPETHRELTGTERFDAVRTFVEDVLRARAEWVGVGTGRPWIVPRMTRCGAAVGEVETFVDTWLIRAGSAVVDAPPAWDTSERLKPLPLPASAQHRLTRGSVMVRCDGTIADTNGRELGVVQRATWPELWKRLWRRQGGLDAPDTSAA